MKLYLKQTRTPWLSFVYVVPLLVLYQATAALSNLGRRQSVLNGADALLQKVLSALGVHGWLGSWLVIAAVTGVLLYRLDKDGRAIRPSWRQFAAVLAESACYALLLGSIVSFLTGLILSGPGFLQIGGGMRIDAGQKLAASLGAGLYEELVFRLLLTGGAVWLLSALGVKRTAAVVLSVLASSVIFSAFHYIPPFGDPFRLDSFTFRFVAGIVFAGLFAVRGFAVAAWTHALYDVFLLVLGRA
jgi:hypothetical protein